MPFEKSAARRAGRKDPMVDIARRGTAGMAVTVDEAGLAEVAERLGVTPQEAVDAVLDCIKSRPWYAARAASRGSLGVALGTVLDNSEIAYGWDEAIKGITGGRGHTIEECAIDLREGVFWYTANFDDGEIDGVHLQFGSDSGETVYASMDIVLKDEKLADEALEEIYGAINIVDEDYPPDFEWNYDDGHLSFSVVVHTGRSFDLPKLDMMEDMVKNIKSIIDEYHRP